MKYIFILIVMLLSPQLLLAELLSDEWYPATQHNYFENKKIDGYMFVSSDGFVFINKLDSEKKDLFSKHFGKNDNVEVIVTGHEKTLYTKTKFQVALNEYFYWLQSTSAQVFYSDSKRVGDQIEMSFKGKIWKFRVFYARLDTNINEMDRGNLAIENYYELGNNYYFEVERPFKKKWTFQFRVRAGQADNLTELTFTHLFKN